MKQKDLFDTDLTEEEIDDMLNSEWYSEDQKKEDEIKCVCGAEKTYGKKSNIHCHYCPKFKK